MYRVAPPDSKVFGDIESVPVGTMFRDRREVAEAGVHGRPNWGIHGSEIEGAYAISVNGHYGDEDRGETIVYTGHGKGRNKDGTTNSTGPQIGDQEWKQGNAALRRSEKTKYPVRVIRGPNGNPKYSPLEGYRYDGLYYVVESKMEPGEHGFKMCKFVLQRATDFHQDPLPRPTDLAKWWNPIGIVPQSFPPPSSSISRTPPRSPVVPDANRSRYTAQQRQEIEGTRRLNKFPRIPKKTSSMSRTT